MNVRAHKCKRNFWKYVKFLLFYFLFNYTYTLVFETHKRRFFIANGCSFKYTS